MNIAIFGASGATGTLLTEHCLAAGYNVNALLRTPEKFPLPGLGVAGETDSGEVSSVIFLGWRRGVFAGVFAKNGVQTVVFWW